MALLVPPSDLTHTNSLSICRHRLEEGQATSWSRRLKVFLCCTRTKDSQSVSRIPRLTSCCQPLRSPHSLAELGVGVGRATRRVLGFKQEQGDNLLSTDRLPPACETANPLLWQGDGQVPRLFIHPLGTQSLV